ncbi:hypothetical protein ACOYR1_01155 [Thalassotalea piscium]
MNTNTFIPIILLFLIGGCSEPNNEVVYEPQKKQTRLHKEDFSQFPFTQINDWRIDPQTYDGPYSESGEYYQAQNIIAPTAFRNSINIGKGDWLTAELYTRTEDPILLDYLDVVSDPQDPNNQVLKISTPKHTDGVVLRSKKALPPKYRIKLKIGFAQYGNNTPLNGYDDGNEKATPWRNLSSVGHNGFYWLSILDSEPKPHNNVWIHHHRKFVIDSWNRSGFNQTVNVIALDGKTQTDSTFGKQFISYVDDQWKRISDVPVDYYLQNEWYEVSFTRTPLFYEFSISGVFKNAGQKTFTDRINIRKNCVYHYNQTIEELSAGCVDNRAQKILDKDFVAWPAQSAYPEYFMLGEPHINYYEGSVLVDDISLEVL